MHEVEVIPELADVVIDVDLVPGTQLVHVAVGDRAGLVLTARQARELGHELERAGRRASGHARPRTRASAAAAA